MGRVETQKIHFLSKWLKVNIRESNVDTLVSPQANERLKHVQSTPEFLLSSSMFCPVLKGNSSKFFGEETTSFPVCVSMTSLSCPEDNRIRHHRSLWTFTTATAALKGSKTSFYHSGHSDHRHSTTQTIPSSINLTTKHLDQCFKRRLAVKSQELFRFPVTHKCFGWGGLPFAGRFAFQSTVLY